MKKFVFLFFTLILILCGCDNNTTISNGRNFLGGEGSFFYSDDSSSLWGDSRNIYFYGSPNYTKLNLETKSFSIACPIPGCSHDSPDCRTYGRRFVSFKGDLIMLENEKISESDGTIYEKGYLYKCGADSKEKVFENVFPSTLPENIKEGRDERLDAAEECGEYLVLYTGVYSYLVDSNFNIKYTIFDMGSAPRVFYLNNEYYYIDKLYRLIKLNIDEEKSEPVNLDGMKITEGDAGNNLIWFSNDFRELCSFDPKTGEVKKYAENAIMIKCAGNYVMYSDYDTGKDLVINILDRNVITINNENYYFDSFNYWNGNYYLSGWTLSDYSGRIIEFDEQMNKTAEYILED